MRAIKLQLLVVFFAATISTQAMAQEHWGQFRSALEGVFIDTASRPNFQLSKEFEFVDPNGLAWSVPVGALVDGASIPQGFWSLIGGPFEGLYLKASVIHDHYCDTKKRTAHDTHRNFYYGMRANGVPEWKAKAMYWVVATFGPSWKLVPRVINKMSCVNRLGIQTCSSVASIEQRLEQTTAPDLANPEVLVLALSKFAATAKTLKSSDGGVLDVRKTGQIDATLDSLDANAASYRGLLTSDDLSQKVDELGILADPNFGNIDAIAAWKDNKIPSTADIATYQSFVLAGEKSLGFTIEGGDLNAIGRSLDLKSLETRVEFRRQNTR